MQIFLYLCTSFENNSKIYIVMKKNLLFILVFLASSVFAQVTTIPSIVQKGYKGEVTIVFNPNEGNKGMVNATKCYAHTGITYNGTSWQNTSGWRDGKDKYKMTKNADGNWELKITPNIYAYYGVPESTNVTQLCFVFNDGPNGTLEGKADGNADIFVDLADAGLAAIISNTLPDISSEGDVVNLECVSTEAATLTLSLNGEQIATAEGTKLTHTITLNETGNYHFIFTAKTATDEAKAEAFTCVAGLPEQAKRPEGVDMGIYYDEEDDTKVTLCTYAASKSAPAKHVFVVGDFNNWVISDDYQMKQDGNYFWLEINGLTPQKEYAMQYVVVRADGVVKRISDLFSEKVLHPNDQYEPKDIDPTLMDYPKEGSDYVTVIQTAKPEFPWSEATLNFKRPDKNNLIIYELWVYDHTPFRSIPGLMDRLDYYEDMGVNAIELMPVTEFDGNENWGYSPNHYFALDKAYGTPEHLKTFIDECHKRGIAVILDMVFNHSTGLNPMNKLYPYGEDLKHNPWFNVSAPHSDNVYEDWNHDFAPAKSMMIRALNYWLTEYKVDGYRMDLSHGLCGTTYDAVDHITEYYEKGVKAVAEDAYFILEHWGSQMGSERPKLISKGMLCWDNTTNAYYQTAMGWLKDGDSFTNANRDGYVSYCESHDEERAFFKAKHFGNGDLQTDDQERIARVPLNMAFLTMLNGPQMFYHFAEFGFDYSKYQDKNGRWGTNPYGEKDVIGYEVKMQAKKRIETWLGEGAWRTDAFHKVAQTIQLRTRIMPEVFEGNPTKVNISGGKKIRTIQWGSDVFVVGNFAVEGNETATLPEGTWYNYFQQKPQTETNLTLAPGEVMIFTGKEVALPELLPYYSFLTDVENIVVENDTEILPPYNVKVYNINGYVISSQNNVMMPDLSGLQSGLYIIQYEKNGAYATKKVIR